MPTSSVLGSVLALLIALTVAPAGSLAAAEPADSGPYLFSYFKDNGEDGLHLAFSEDGNHWTALNQDRSLLAPTVGGKLMRDPSIVRAPDGVFHMVWSSSWADRGFGYASSPDLIRWSPQQFIPVNEKIPGADNTWAPDLFYDAKSRQFVAVFATTVPGRFPETDKGGDQNHRLYQVTTQDFKTWSSPAIAMNPGYNSIDGTLFAANDELSMIYKDERPGKKRLHQVTTTELGGKWSTSAAPIIDRDWVEGPTVLRLKDRWRVYFDCYTKGHYGAAESVDGRDWADVTDLVKFPHGARHGTTFAVPREIVEALQALPAAE